MATDAERLCPFGPGFDFTDPDVLLRGIPVTEFAELRRTAPVWWNEQPESIFDDGGYWVISRHEDIKAISRDGELWSTNRKGVVMRMPDGVTSRSARTDEGPADQPRRARAHPAAQVGVATVHAARSRRARGEARRRRPAKSSPTAAEKDERQLRRRHRDAPAVAGDRRPDRRTRGRSARSCSDWTNAIMNTDDPDFDPIGPCGATPS